MRPACRAALAAAALALIVGGVGLGARDLAGDEIAMLTGSVEGILADSLHPDARFTGHLPFSYLARAGNLDRLDPTWAWAWRLHALVAFVLAGAATARAAPRSGLLAGALLALCPVAAFHAQDSSNYAVSLLTGALVVGGLLRRELRAWLAVGLTIAVVNDLYSLWLLCGAGVASLAWLRADRRALRAWAPAALVGLPVAAVVWMQLSGEAVAHHADPAPEALSALDVVLARLHRFVGAALHGYAAGRGTAGWERVPALAALGALMLAGLRDAAVRPASRLLVGGLAAASLASAAVLALGDRVLPVEPRSMITLLPALCVAAAGLVGRLPRGLRGATGAALVLLLAGATLEQSLARSTRHRDVAREVAARWAPGEVVVAEERVRWRLRAEGLPEAALQDCLLAEPDAPALWWVRLQPLDHPLSWDGCMAGDGTVQPVALPGWRATWSWTRGPPAHERNAASFLRPVSVVRYAPGAPVGRPEAVPVAVTRSLLDGAAGGTLEVVGDRGTREWRGLPPPGGAASVPTHGEAQVRLRVAPRFWPTLPAWALLDPLRRDVQEFEPLLVPDGPTEAPLEVATQPLRAPAWQVLRRLLAAFAAGGLALAALRRPA